MTAEIRKSKKGPYYELYVDGVFEGNYDTAGEAARAYDEIVKEREGAAYEENTLLTALATSGLSFDQLGVF